MQMIKTREIRYNEATDLIRAAERQLKSGQLGATIAEQRSNALNIILKGTRSIEVGLARFVTEDPAMLEMKSKLRLLYERPEPVLITGPTGTGKEILAKALTRPGSPFIAENCAAIPENLVESVFFGHVKGAFTGAHEDRAGLLEQAEEGIIFLDEIGDMPLSLQAKFLRAIQESEIRRVGGRTIINLDCRFVAATKYDLEERVAQKLFREDLYARLMTFEIKVTGLINRPADIPVITKSLIADPTKYGAPLNEGGMPEFTGATLERIYKFNVRGIETALSRWRAFQSYE